MQFGKAPLRIVPPSGVRMDMCGGGACMPARTAI